MGAGWATAMYIIFELFPILTGDGGDNPWSRAIIGLSGWIIGGFTFGFLMWFFLVRRKKKRA